MPRPSAATIVLGVLCLGALGIATNIATSALPSAWSPYPWLEARIELGMTVTVDAPHPWGVVMASPNGSSRVVAAGTTVTEVFDELDETMLVLGAPGSGKTT
ncbi:MAG: hypothetical protein ACRDUV_13930 [Pseudonocardiaceae bacterium]